VVVGEDPLAAVGDEPECFTRRPLSLREIAREVLLFEQAPLKCLSAPITLNVAKLVHATGDTGVPACVLNDRTECLAFRLTLRLGFCREKGRQRNRFLDSSSHRDEVLGMDKSFARFAT